MPQSSHRLRERRNGLVWLLFLARGSKVFIYFLIFLFARTATHVWARTYGHARAKERPGVVVVSGTRFESFFFFARTATSKYCISKRTQIKKLNNFGCQTMYPIRLKFKTYIPHHDSIINVKFHGD